ncbi:MAG: prephenate dehydratase [Candidatus Cohnella colombiensis]|uniref:Prephenate dehydratase n=1 Tax=Candidatus Cohnella colombiensis TaxID=3121368 RepID=A0AA95JCM9_9BACL|nr:MAG: prephenate dehydratase [Cohnella sp.]
MTKRKSVALLPQSTVSDEATRYLLQNHDIDLVYCTMISDVFLSTANGHTNWSVIPIENTIDGSVSLHMDWLVHEVDLPIQAEWVFPSIQNLIGHASELNGEDGTWDPGKIKKIMSHPVAMAQCLQFIRSHIPNAELETLSSTTESVRTVQANPGKGWAAIGTKLAASDLGLDLLEEKVTDHDNNFTRFLLVGQESLEFPNASHHKTSILITPPDDYPGALHQVLSAFSWRRINLSRIESRPTKKKLGNYYFYLDIELSMDTVLLPLALAEIEAIGCQVRILGSYPSIPFVL